MKKGITLVALVVTIVILLILSTVTISMIIGNDGIVSKSREGKYKTEIAQIVERLDNASAAVMTDMLYGAFTQTNSLPDVKAKLIENNAKDQGIIDTYMTKPFPLQDIYTITYTLPDSNFQLVYTLNLVDKSSSHVINPIP